GLVVGRLSVVESQDDGRFGTVESLRRVPGLPEPSHADTCAADLSQLGAKLAGENPGFHVRLRGGRGPGAWSDAVVHEHGEAAQPTRCHVASLRPPRKCRTPTREARVLLG